VQARIKKHIHKQKNKVKVSPPEETITQSLTEDEIEQNLEPITASVKDRKLIYLSYSYSYRSMVSPVWVAPLKEALEAEGYLGFNPLQSVEEQFQEEHKEDLVGLTSKVPSSMIGLLKLNSEILAPIQTQSVIQTLRAGDKRIDADSVTFKELYFLLRSSVVICDLTQEPYGFEVLHKLFICKLLDIPTIGIAPAGIAVNPFVQKYVKVLLTDDFNVANVLPLVRAYA